MAKNQHQIVNEISDDLGLKRSIVASVYDKFIENILETLYQGEDVIINRVIEFKLVNLPARERRNPRTGEIVTVGPNRTVKLYKRSHLSRINEKLDENGAPILDAPHHVFYKGDSEAESSVDVENEWGEGAESDE